MEKNTSEKWTEGDCNRCAHQRNTQYCYHCIRQYNGLPDLYTSADSYFEAVPSEKNIANSWPDNLYRAVAELSENEYTRRPKGLLFKTDLALESLRNPREEQVLRLRFESGLKLYNVGCILGITAERVRQIQGKALKKLRHPYRRMILEYGEGNVEKSPMEIDYLTPETDSQGNRYNHEQNISELGISLRACLALKRAGIHTVKELMEVYEKGLLEIKGIGPVCAGHIEEALKKTVLKK